MLARIFVCCDNLRAHGETSRAVRRISGVRRRRSVARSATRKGARRGYLRVSAHELEIGGSRCMLPWHRQDCLCY